MIALSGAVLVYGLGLLSYMLLKPTPDDPTWLLLLHACSAASFYVYLRKSYWGEGGYESFGAAMLLFAIAYKAIAFADTAVYGTRLDTWPTTLLDDAIVQDLLFGEAITQLGYFVVVLAWRAAVRWNFAALGFTWSEPTRPRAAWSVYLLALGFEAASRLFGVSYGPAEQLIASVHIFGTASIIVLAIDARGGHFRTALNALALGLPFAVLALGAGMKESLFFPLVPFGLFLWHACEGRLMKAVVIVGATGIFGLSQAYVHHVRKTTWSEERSESSIVTSVSGFRDKFVADGSTELEDGLDGFLARANPTLTHAITIAVARQQGHYPHEIFEAIPASFIPRALWPEKPVLMPGAQHSVRIRGEGEVSDVGSATAAGFVTELYLGGGMLAVLVGALIFGLLQGLLQARVRQRHPGAALAIFNYSLFYLAIRFDERHIAYAFTGMLALYLAHMLVFKVFIRFGWKVRPQPRWSRPPLYGSGLRSSDR